MIANVSDGDGQLPFDDTFVLYASFPACLPFFYEKQKLARETEE